jgi:trk system potassium uptake protein TrkA
MYVVIVGGGRTGSQLTKKLLEGGHTVRLIDHRQNVLERLKYELPTEVVVAGDGSSPAALEAAGIQHAHVLAAVTEEDEANLVIATLAKYEFGVMRVIARVNNPKNAWLFNPEMGVDVALNQADILATLIAEEMSLGDMMTLLQLRKGEYSVVEEKVHPEALVAGKPLKAIKLPPQSRFIAILRKGVLIVPDGEAILNPMDEVIALVHASQVINLAALLGKPKT